MTKTRDQLFEEAFGWILRLREADVRDWEEFVRWLEADPTHLRIYEELATIDARASDLPPVETSLATPPKSVRRTGPTRRVMLGWGVAAALVAMIGYSGRNWNDDSYAIETRPGEKRFVSLAEGSNIHLNGSSRIILDRTEPRDVKLERGEALFTVVHDPSVTFRVAVAGAEVRDVGTTFNIVHDAELVKVEVAEGEVIYTSRGEDVSLSQGDTLRQEGRSLITGRRDPSEIGVWRKGHLSYSSASIAEVAADLSRNTGLVVRAGPEVAARRFSGVIILDSDKAQLFRRAGALLGVNARRAGEEWLLTAAPP